MKADHTPCSTFTCYTCHVPISASIYSYLLADNVVYLVFTDKSYPRKLAFSYLDEISKEFATSYGAKVDSVRKPYAFVGFGMVTLRPNPKFAEAFAFLDTFMAKTARLYQDTRQAGAGSSNLDKLNDELHDVTRIMTKNMEELLWRGDSLDSASVLLILILYTLTSD